MLEVPPVAVAYVPAEQSMQVELSPEGSTPEYFPAVLVQSRQKELDQAPTESVKLPATQSVQTWSEFAAATLEYLPAAHAKHIDACKLEYVPAAQSTHVDSSVAPDAFEYLPASHDKHVKLDDALSDPE